MENTDCILILLTSGFIQISKSQSSFFGSESTATMPEGRTPAIFIYAKFNVEALCRLASALRQGIACTCAMNQLLATGRFNWAIFVSFEDGIQWVLRSPYQREEALSELNLKLLASEAATL